MGWNAVIGQLAKGRLTYFKALEMISEALEEMPEWMQRKTGREKVLEGIDDTIRGWIKTRKLDDDDLDSVFVSEGQTETIKNIHNQVMNDE